MLKVESIKRIKSHYVSDDCVQVMIPYKKEMTLLSSDDILFHHYRYGGIDCGVNINKYTLDDRRYLFPYGSIPLHKELDKLEAGTGIYTKANQLFDYKKNYIKIEDGYIIQYYVEKDGDEAIAVTNFLLPRYSLSFKTKEEVDELFKKDTKEEIIILTYEGGIVNQPVYISGDTFRYNGGKFVLDETEINNDVLPYLLDFIPTPEKKVTNIKLTENDLIVIRNYNEDIRVEALRIKKVPSDSFDLYGVETFEYGLTKYNKQYLLNQESENSQSKEPHPLMILHSKETRKRIRLAKQKIKNIQNTTK